MTISGLIQKEFNRIRSDKRTLILLFTIPMILIIIFGLTTGVFFLFIGIRSSSKRFLKK